MSIHLDISGELTLRQQLKVLALPAAKRKRLSATLGRKVRGYSRKRLRSQTGLNGRQWPARKHGNRKMLRGFSKRLRLRSQAQGAELRFADSVTGRIAYRHQHGVDETMTPEKMRHLHGEPDYSLPATRRQARALREAGYRVRRQHGKGWKKPTLRWMTENLTQGQAGLVLRLLQDRASTQSWVIPLPARSFLGVSPHEINQLVTTVFDETLRQLKRA